MVKVAFLAALLASPAALASPTLILIDGETPATGSGLGTEPLVTGAGTVTFIGEFRGDPSDPEFIAAGAAGNIFDIDGAASQAEFLFDFDVDEFTFIYGGNSGVFDIRAFDIAGVEIDSFFQPDTASDQPAGPETLSGPGIRRVMWMDPGNSFAPLDNITLLVNADEVPTPAALALFGLGALGLARFRRHI